MTEENRLVEGQAESADFAEKTLTETEIYHGAILRLREDTAMMPDGQAVEREVVEHPGGVGIALEDPEDGKFFLVTQCRYAQGCVTLEFPAGKKEPGEDPFLTGQREIIEETGYEGTDWKYLGRIFPTPAYDTEVIELYYARKGPFRGQHLDSDEYLHVKKYTLDEITDRILRHEIPDAKTVAMTFLLKEMKKSHQI